MKTEYKNIKRITAYVGGYFGSSYTVEVEFLSGNITYEVSEMGIIEPDLPIQMDNEVIAIFVEELAKCRIIEWENEYIQPNAMDGTQWSLDINLESEVLHKHGNNDFPNEWERFCKAIQKLTGKPFQ